MKYTTVDKITRSMLIQLRLPLHFYIQFAKYALDCIRELTFDSMRVVNTTLLEINENFYAELPCGFVDFTFVGIRQGQFVQPITQRQSINNLPALTPQGAITTYGDPTTQSLDFPFWPGYWMFQNIDDLGENTGRLYGWNTGIDNNGFKIIPERNIIQFTESFTRCHAVMEWIGDGQCADSATKVDPMAQACIEAYMRWRFSSNDSIERSPEGASYFNQRRLYRARKDELTPYEIRNILYRNYRASIKN